MVLPVAVRARAWLWFIHHARGTSLLYGLSGLEFGLWPEHAYTASLNVCVDIRSS